ncbi:MAG: hypothetical protein A2047_01015 [Omnitrophica bacterium GWA2_41_15]|nr:MAG: hypothetical protein A2047_01015 [Omnitrophica bacterium GWA2_41_15]
MLSLYFNFRLTGQRLIPDRIDSGLFYPVAYPQRGSTGSLSQYAVLLKTIESYSVFKFDVVIFNIAIDFIDSEIEEELKRSITEKYSSNKIILRFTRPSTLDEWKKDVEEVSCLIGKGSPVLVAMNHDHPFIDYTPEVFNVLLEKVFPKLENNFGKALYYSHAPEAISSAVNDRSHTKYIRQSGGIYKREVTSRGVLSIWVMTIETLGHILSRAMCSGSSYMGRIDWAGVEYDQLTLTTYLFPREFFKHYDGYRHVTGIRLISDISNAKSTVLQFPGDDEANGIVEFYYQRWIDCFLLTVRDALRNKKYSVASNMSTKSIFTKAIEESLDLFRIGYLEADVAAGLIHERRISVMEGALRSHIYYFGNLLFESVKTDILLIDGDGFYKYMNLIKRHMPSLLRRILKIIVSHLKSNR